MGMMINQAQVASQPEGPSTRMN